MAPEARIRAAQEGDSEAAVTVGGTSGGGLLGSPSAAESGIGRGGRLSLSAVSSGALAAFAGWGVRFRRRITSGLSGAGAKGLDLCTSAGLVPRSGCPGKGCDPERLSSAEVIQRTEL